MAYTMIIFIFYLALYAIDYTFALIAGEPLSVLGRLLAATLITYCVIRIFSTTND